MTKPKRIMITGGLGFIGSCAVKRLVQNGAECLIVDANKSGSDIRNINEIKSAKNLEISNVDITVFDEIEKQIKNFEPETIFHFAAESHVDRSIADPRPFLESNIIGTFNILEAIRKSRNKNRTRILHVSTDEVYGALGLSGSFSEQTQIAPSSPYSATKASSDLLALAWQKTYEVDVVVTNCSNNFGPNQHREKFIPLVINQLRNNLPVGVYGDGANIRDWLFVEDHIDALIEIEKKSVSGARYNIGGGTEISNINLLKKIWSLMVEKKATELNFKESHYFTADRPGHDFRYSIDSTKLKNEIGWTPSRKFDDSLMQTVEFYLKEDR